MTSFARSVNHPIRREVLNKLRIKTAEKEKT